MANVGDRQINKRTGEVATFDGTNWVVGGKGAPPADAGLRGRLAMGLGPMVQAQQTMEAAEANGNPLQKDWGASLLDGVEIPFLGRPLSTVAAAVGGDDYQAYKQAQAAYESQLMPIMSGAAVSPSEAERQIKAAMGSFKDGKGSLQNKSITRRMMLNGAAKAAGAPLPYPDTPTYGVNSAALPAARVPAKAVAAPVQVRSLDEAMKLKPGTPFITPDGRRKVR